MAPASQSPRIAPPTGRLHTARSTASTPTSKTRVHVKKQATAAYSLESQVYAERPDLFVQYKRPTASQATAADNIAAAAAQERGPDDFVQEEDGIALIAPTGDLVLDIRQDHTSPQFSYRVQAATLKSVSLYFDRLLGQTFREGRDVEKQLAALTVEHGAADTMSASKLPRVSIEHVGQISAKVKSIHPLMTDLLAILHHRDTTGRKVPLPNLANLCVVADRFDCTAAVSRWAHAKGILRPTAPTQTLPGEDTQRQKAYVGLLLDYNPWLIKHSTQLILGGSQRWSPDAHAIAEADTPWYDLPRGVEDELYFRRDCVLGAVASLIEHCFESYTSSARQCKLGYDTSAQCDAFQLGQFVKYMSKKNLLDFKASWSESSCSSGTSQVRSITNLLQTLRELPAYQVDANHAHCGPRKRLLSNLAVIEQHLGEQWLGISLPADNNDSGWSWQIQKPLAQVAVQSLRRSAASSRVHPEATRGNAAYRLFVANAWQWAEGDT